MGVVIAADRANPVLDTAAEATDASTAALEEADVLAMRTFLSGWHGDLRSLVDRDGSPGSGRSR